jgi:hypothetical protein
VPGEEAARHASDGVADRSEVGIRVKFVDRLFNRSWLLNRDHARVQIITTKAGAFTCAEVDSLAKR